MKYTIFHYLKADITVKSVSLLVTIFMLLTAVPGMVNALETTDDETITTTIDFTFSSPQIIPDGEYVKVKVDDLEMRLKETQPQLPILTKSIELPIGAEEIKVTIDQSPEESMTFDGMIAPCPLSVPLLPDREYPLVKILLNYGRLLSNAIQEKTGDTQNQIDIIEGTTYDESGSYGKRSEYEILVGRNMENELALFVEVRIMPCLYQSGELAYITDATVTVTYKDGVSSLSLDEDDEHIDLLILAPKGYIKDLQPLVDHKNALDERDDTDMKTKLVSLDEIYSEAYFDLPDWMRDDQEKIKYFMYITTLEWGVSYVLAVGGFRTFLGFNNPNVQFPVRMSHNVDGEPGYIAEQYYSCFLRYDEDLDEIVFDTWDSNQNDVFAEWHFGGWDKYDPIIDVNFGRLACRNRYEVRTMVDKIIYYETNTYGQEWFDEMLSVTGDGFQDIGYKTPLTVNWDVSLVPNGDYTIYAQSRIGELYGPIDEVHITVDHAAESRVTFYEDDHLKIEPLTEEQETLYPGKPVAEIVVPQDNDVLGNTDVNFVPPEAYLGNYWAFVDYNATRSIIKIQSKSYDPSPHALHDDWNGGSQTIEEIWINNSDGDTIFGPVTRDSEAYWEGEIEGEQALLFAGTSYNKTRIWTSNGGFNGMWDVINAFSKGYGLAYVNGHSSCMVYGDHYPGVPGGRDDGQVNGWATINLKYGLERYQATEGDPLFPLDQLTNGNKLPVLLYSGCHSGQFDTSLVSLLHDPYNVLFGDRYGTWAPEGCAWWITRLPQGGSIATIGNTGLGSGYIGENILSGLTGWLFPHFFSYYNALGGKNVAHLGEVHRITLMEYHLSENGDAIYDQTVRKHFEQWNLLGDPSLKIGGYPPEETSALDKTSTEEHQLYAYIDEDTSLDFKQLNSIRSLSAPGYQVTENPANDTSPESIVSTENGKFLVGYTYVTPGAGDIHPGFAFSNGGALWNEIVYPTPADTGRSSIYSWIDDEGDQYALGSVPFGASIGAFNINDLTNPDSWGFVGHQWLIGGLGANGLAITGYFDGDSLDYGGLWTEADKVQAYFGNYVNEGLPGPIPYGRYTIEGGPFHHLSGCCDHSTGWHFYVCEKQADDSGYVLAGLPAPYSSTGHTQWVEIPISSGFVNPKVLADDGVTYIISEDGASIICRRSSDNGETWDIYSVTSEGSQPKVFLTDDGDIECYFIRDSNIYKTISEDQGVTWSVAMLFSDVVLDDSMYSPFHITSEGMVFAQDDGDLYANIFIGTIAVMMSDFTVVDQGIISVEISNSGTMYTDDLDWEITMEGISPLGEFFSSQPGQLLYELLKGRVRRGSASGQISLSPDESEEITSDPAFGLGHVEITLTITDDESEVIAQKSEDAFLLGGRILLIYPEE